MLYEIFFNPYNSFFNQHTLFLSKLPQNQEELPYRFLHQFHHGERYSLDKIVVNSNQNELPMIIKFLPHSSLLPIQKFLDSPLHMFVCILLRPTLLYIIQGIHQLCNYKYPLATYYFLPFW